MCVRASNIPPSACFNAGFVNLRDQMRKVAATHGTNVVLVSAIIAAGLYPNIAMLPLSDPKGTTVVPAGLSGPLSCKLYGSATETVIVEKQSVVGLGRGKVAKPKDVDEDTHRMLLKSRFVTYFEKAGGSTHRTPRLRHVTRIAPAAVLVFGNSGDLVVKHLESKVVVDEWQTLHAPPTVALKLRELRGMLKETLEAFVGHDPRPLVEKEYCGVLDEVVKALA